MNANAELQNGRWAMIGFDIALLNYVLTGQIIPGIFWSSKEVPTFIPWAVWLREYFIIQTNKHYSIRANQQL